MLPLKNQSPATIHPNGAKSFKGPLQFFEMIAERYTKIGIGFSVVQHLQLPKKPIL